MSIKESPYYSFYLLESKYKLFHIDIDGVYIWQLLRFNLLKKISCGGNICRRNKKIRISLICRFVKLCLCSIFCIYYIFRGKNNKIMCIRPIYTVDMNLNKNDHQFDYLGTDFIKNAVNIYALGEYKLNGSIREVNLSLAELILSFWKLKQKICKIKPVISDKEIGNIKLFLDEINSIYSTNFDFNLLFSDIPYVIASHRIYKKTFQKYFNIFSPKAILLYPHYDEHMFSAIDAAKSLGIPTIELQHGRINSHESYSYFENNLYGKYLPNYFFTYGEWWNLQINLPSYCKVISIGNSFLQSQLLCCSSLKETKQICFFSGPPTGKDLSEFVAKNIALLKKEGYKVVYKLHPNEIKNWKLTYPQLINSEIIVVDDPNVSIYSLLAKSEVVVAISSTCLFEATVFKTKKIFVYGKGNYAAMAPLLKINKATFIKSASDLLNYLKSNNSKISSCQNNFSNELWKRYSPDYFNNTIKNIMTKSI